MEVLGLSVYFHLINVFIFAVHLLQTAYSWVLIISSDNLSLLTVDIIVFRSTILLFVSLSPQFGSSFPSFLPAFKLFD